MPITTGETLLENDAETGPEDVAAVAADVELKVEAARPSAGVVGEVDSEFDVDALIDGIISQGCHGSPLSTGSVA